MNISSYRSTMAIALVSCLAIACGDDTERPGRETPGQTPDGSTGLDGSEHTQDPDGGHDDEDAGTHDHEDAGDAGGPEDGGNTEDPSTEACPANTEGCACTPVPNGVGQGSCNEGMICVNWGMVLYKRTLSKEGNFATCVKPCTEDSQCASPDIPNRQCSSINVGGLLNDDMARPYEGIKKICTDREVKSGEVCGMSRNIESWTKDSKGEDNASITKRQMVGCEGNGSCTPVFGDLNPDESVCMDFCSEDSECGGDTPKCALQFFSPSTQIVRPKVCAVSDNKTGDHCSNLWGKEKRMFINGCSGASSRCLPMPPEIGFRAGGNGSICADVYRPANPEQGDPEIACPAGTTVDNSLPAVFGDNARAFNNICSNNCTSAPENCKPVDGKERACVDYTVLNTPTNPNNPNQPGRNFTLALCASKTVVEPPLEEVVFDVGADNSLVPKDSRDARCLTADMGYTACPEGTSCVFLEMTQAEVPVGACMKTCDTGKRLDPGTGKTVTSTWTAEPLCAEGLRCYSRKVPHRPEMGYCITSTLTE